MTALEKQRNDIDAAEDMSQGVAGPGPSRIICIGDSELANLLEEVQYLLGPL